MTEIEVDVRGQTCPVPLVQFRKTVKKAAPGDIIVVRSTHPASKKEIPMACEFLGLKVLEVKDLEEGKGWEIRVQK